MVTARDIVVGLPSLVVIPYWELEVMVVEAARIRPALFKAAESDP